jgi:sec-independent protein translocase protein TatC
MAREPEAQRPDFDEEEEGGGPVKTFLEHLEDLRWTLIKSLSAILVAMVVCLIAGNRLVAVLTWPLKHAQTVLGRELRQVVVLWGDKVITKLKPSDLAGLPLGTNPIGSVRLNLEPMGTNLVLALVASPERPQRAEGPVILKNYTPIEGILVAMKLALYGGLVLAAPFVFFFVGQFVLPALKVKEKRILYRAVGFGSGLFFIGVLFCYFVIAGIALGATVQFSKWMGFEADEWRADAYVGFMCKFMLGMGLGFELPVVILTLVKIELLDYEKLAHFRPYAIVGNLVIAAFATPSGDPVTMVLMALPLHLLYEVSVLIARVWERRKKRDEAAALHRRAGVGSAT